MDGPCSARNTMPLSGRVEPSYGMRFADQRRQFRRLVRVIFQHVTKRAGKGLVAGEGSGGHSFSPGSGNIDRGIVFDFIDLKDEFKHCYQFCLSEGLEHP